MINKIAIKSDGEGEVDLDRPRELGGYTLVLCPRPTRPRAKGRGKGWLGTLEHIVPSPR